MTQHWIEISPEWSKNLIRLRKDKKKSLRAVYKDIGIDPSTLCRLEQFKQKRIHISTIDILSKYYEEDLTVGLCVSDTYDEYRDLFTMFQALNEENRILRSYISHKWGEEELKRVSEQIVHKLSEEELKRRIEQVFSRKEGTE